MGEEFLKSNRFLNSEDETVKKHAANAVGKLTDPWEKAKAIERWVRANMKSEDFTEAMATSDHVAKTLKGDCSEFSMLAAAMCRAQGIPSRTAAPGSGFMSTARRKDTDLGIPYVDGSLCQGSMARPRRHAGQRLDRARPHQDHRS